MKPTGISSTWWVIMTIGGARRVPGQPAQAGHQALPAAHVQAGGRLVEQQQGRFAHEGPGQQDVLSFAVGKHAEGPVGDGLEPGAGQQARARARSSSS